MSYNPLDDALLFPVGPGGVPFGPPPVIVVQPGSPAHDYLFPGAAPPPAASPPPAAAPPPAAPPPSSPPPSSPPPSHELPPTPDPGSVPPGTLDPGTIRGDVPFGPFFEREERRPRGMPPMPSPYWIGALPGQTMPSGGDAFEEVLRRPRQRHPFEELLQKRRGDPDFERLMRGSMRRPTAGLPPMADIDAAARQVVRGALGRAVARQVVRAVNPLAEILIGVLTPSRVDPGTVFPIPEGPPLEVVVRRGAPPADSRPDTRKERPPRAPQPQTPPMGTPAPIPRPIPRRFRWPFVVPIISPLSPFTLPTPAPQPFAPPSSPPTPGAPPPSFTPPQPFAPPTPAPSPAPQPLPFSPGSPENCRCDEPGERRRRKRPSDVIANVTPFPRRMSQNSLDNLRRG